jgi:hypothetical protein
MTGARRRWVRQDSLLDNSEDPRLSGLPGGARPTLVVVAVGFDWSKRFYLIDRAAEVGKIEHPMSAKRRNGGRRHEQLRVVARLGLARRYVNAICAICVAGRGRDGRSTRRRGGPDGLARCQPRSSTVEIPSHARAVGFGDPRVRGPYGLGGATEGALNLPRSGSHEPNCLFPRFLPSIR